MTLNTILTLFVPFSILLLISKLAKGSVIRERKIEPDNAVQEADTVTNLSNEGMTEYTRAMSYDLGFNRVGVKFSRQQELKRKGLPADEEIYLEKCKMLDEKFSEAMKNLIPLRLLKSEQTLKNKTIRVFIDTMNDTKVLARDDSAMIELDLNTVYNKIAGEFVLINLYKEGEDLKINYVLADSSKNSSKKTI